MDQSSTPLQPVNPVPQSADAAALTAHARIERLSEPSAINCAVAIFVTLFLSILLGSWAAAGQIDNIILLLVWFGAAMVIIFVQDYWWAPLLVITASAFGTTALGFPMSGMEIGVIILTLTLPIKMAMKTLRKAEPEMRFPTAYLALVGFVCIHAVVILFYNKIQGIELKNIVKAYYTAITPLIFTGLLIRYCHIRTVWPVMKILFFTTLFTVTVSIIVTVKGISFEGFSDLRISIAWLDADSAQGILRRDAPYLFIAALAVWPAVRRGLPRWLVVFAAFSGALGAMESAGRLSVGICIAAAAIIAVVRGKFWLALPVVIILVTAVGIITANPSITYNLPDTLQRSLAPLNFSEEQTDVQMGLEGSDAWHKTLRDRSFTYWFTDTNSFWLGHGYKSWDADMTGIDDMDAVQQDHLADIAVEMGLTENMFSSITNIFGTVGLFLYVWFLAYVGWNMFKVCRIAPLGSHTRALCEFSLIGLIANILFCFMMGSVPGLNLIYWMLGFIAARPYLGEEETVLAPLAPERPAFARPAYAETAPRGPNTAVVRPRHLGAGRV